jgi:hypothetical protein
MRMLFLIPLVSLGACQVTEDKGNNQVTVQYNQDVAQNAAADVVNGAKEAGAAISNSASDAADKVKNVDVDVNVDTNKADNNKAANSN